MIAGYIKKGVILNDPTGNFFKPNCTLSMLISGSSLKNAWTMLHTPGHLVYFENGFD